MLFFIWAEKLPVAIVARQTLLRYAGIVALVALVWLRCA
jgi:MscS family membrane protein